MQMLIEAVGMLAIAAGVFVFAAACAWSVQTLKQETGGVFSLSIIAGAFVFYNLIVKIGNGDAAFHNYVIGLIALAVIALDTRIVWKQYGRKAALARAFSSVYGALVLVVIATLFLVAEARSRMTNREGPLLNMTSGVGILPQDCYLKKLYELSLAVFQFLKKTNHIENTAQLTDFYHRRNLYEYIRYPDL